MATSVYTVTTSFTGAAVMQVEQAELERLQELGVVTAILGVAASADDIVITDGQIPPNPVVGTVWFDRSL